MLVGSSSALITTRNGASPSAEIIIPDAFYFLEMFRVAAEVFGVVLVDDS